jgi:hypothetical protein
MSVGKIIEQHKKSKTLTKEEQKQRDELVEELVAERQTEPPPPPPPKKRGRPSKSPTPRPKPLPEEWQRDKTQEAIPVNVIADRLKKRKLLKELRMLRASFPEVLEPFLCRVNPYEGSYAELSMLVSSCKEAVRDETDAQYGPAIAENVLSSIETVMIKVASENRDNFLGSFVHLSSFTKEAVANKAIDTELKIIGCEMTSFLPDNPFLRLLLNLTQVAVNVYHKNVANELMDNIANDERYKDF